MLSKDYVWAWYGKWESLGNGIRVVATTGAEDWAAYIGPLNWPNLRVLKMRTHEQLEAAIALVTEDGMANFLQTEEGPMLFLNCNDVFGYACADAEPVPWDSVIEVKRLFDKGGWEATIDWVAKRRGMLRLQ